MFKRFGDSVIDVFKILSPIVRYCKDKEDDDVEEEDEDEGAHLAHLIGPIFGFLMVFHTIYQANFELLLLCYFQT